MIYRQRIRRIIYKRRIIISITEILRVSKVQYVRKVGHLTFFFFTKKHGEKREFVFPNCFASRNKKTRLPGIVSPISRLRKKRDREIERDSDIFRSCWSSLILKESSSRQIFYGRISFSNDSRNNVFVTELHFGNSLTLVCPSPVFVYIAETVARGNTANG